jgi:hypothetical protein
MIQVRPTKKSKPNPTTPKKKGQTTSAAAKTKTKTPTQAKTTAGAKSKSSGKGKGTTKGKGNGKGKGKEIAGKQGKLVGDGELEISDDNGLFSESFSFSGFFHHLPLGFGHSIFEVPRSRFQPRSSHPSLGPKTTFYLFPTSPVTTYETRFLPGTELVDTDLDDDAISYRHVDALMDPQTPIIQVLEEWLLNYQATGGEGDEDEEEAREEEKRYLAELVGFVWRVSLEGLSLRSLRRSKMCWQ